MIKKDENSSKLLASSSLFSLNPLNIFSSLISDKKQTNPIPTNKSITNHNTDPNEYVNDISTLTATKTNQWVDPYPSIDPAPTLNVQEKENSDRLL